MAKRARSKSAAAGKAVPHVPAKQRLNSYRKLIEIFDQERRLLAYEIHDGVVQDVIGAKMLADALVDSHPECRDDLLPLVKLLSAAIDEARRLVRELRPIVIDEMGLAAALEFHINELRPTRRLKINFEHNVRFRRLPALLEGAIYRIAQEALTNARRHSRASQVDVRLTEQGGQIMLEVEDAGVGFDPQKVPANRYGLEGIRERARLLGGEAVVRSAPSQGTLVRVVFPFDGDERKAPAARQKQPKAGRKTAKEPAAKRSGAPRGKRPGASPEKR